MNIAFFEVADWEVPLLKEKLGNHRPYVSPTHLSGENLSEVKDCQILSTRTYSQLTATILAQLPKLKLIASRTTGFDHIDLDFCKAHHITVCNVPTYGINTVAEHTLALMLSLARQIIPAVERTKQGDFRLEGLRGWELAGKTLGVVGLGHIGTRVAKLALAFKMKVLTHTRSIKPELVGRLRLTITDLPTLLSRSDIVSLHVPLTSATRHLINKENIKLMKRGSFLINTSRGAVVETEAIIWALEQDILAGAGLDVLEEECFLKEEMQLLSSEFLQTCDLKTQLLNHLLLKKANVIITPHNAFNSIEALREILTTTAANIDAFLEGNPINVVI